MLDKIWLSSPHLSGGEQRYVQEAFATNWIAPLGPNVDAFEKTISEYTGVKDSAVLSSGTAAIHLALILLQISQGDVVLCQSMTFAASANPIRYQGAVPVFIDEEPETWNMCPQHLERAIQDLLSKNLRPKAIIAVHLYGNPAKMDEIGGIASHYGIPIIEDAAEALGATYGERRCGNLGTLGVLSFNGNKIITTSGGGALLGNDPEMISRARFLATQARDPAPHYQHSSVGYNYRLSNVLAGVGRGQMEVLSLRVQQRRENFERYKSYFQKWNDQGFDIRFQPELPQAQSNRWLTSILVDPANNFGLDREVLRLGLQENNIEARPLWKPMHLQPVFRGTAFYGAGVGEYLFDNGLCLPSGSNLTNEDFVRIFSTMDEIFAKWDMDKIE